MESVPVCRCPKHLLPISFCHAGGIGAFAAYSSVGVSLRCAGCWIGNVPFLPTSTAVERVARDNCSLVISDNGVLCVVAKLFVSASSRLVCLASLCNRQRDSTRKSLGACQCKCHHFGYARFRSSRHGGIGLTRFRSFR